jgi:serine/threonine protein kinase
MSTIEIEADDDRDPVEWLAEQYVARRRRGEPATVEEYAALCPERSDEIRELFPVIAAIELGRPPSSPARPARFAAGVLPRDRLGDCRLIRELGRGGMGVVYEAIQDPLGRRVAVKVLPRVPGGDDRAMLRFEREASTAASLHHPNIVPVFGAGEDDGIPYYVMQFIPGVGLDRVIRELAKAPSRSDSVVALPPSSDTDRISSMAATAAPPEQAAWVAQALRDGSFAPGSGSGSTAKGNGTTNLNLVPELEPSIPARLGTAYWRSVARVGFQAAEALRYAHERAVLHRDIKPANLLLDAAGHVWVADFGLAKAAGNSELSHSGDLIGTIRYMAPERFRGEGDHRSDLYALGLTLYELITLRPAFAASDRGDLLRRVATEAPPQPSKLVPGIPPDLETVVLKAISADPNTRYATATELRDDLKRFLDGLPVLARRQGPLEHLVGWARRNQALAALSVATLLLAMVAFHFIRLWFYAPRRIPREFEPAFLEPGQPPPRGRFGPERPPPPPPPGFDPGPP